MLNRDKHMIVNEIQHGTCPCISGQYVLSQTLMPFCNLGRWLQLIIEDVCGKPEAFPNALGTFLGEIIHTLVSENYK